MKYALCSFNNEDLSVFPVRMSMELGEAQRALSWQRVGAGQFEDWRIVPMWQLVAFLKREKVSLSCFTEAAQKEKREEIMKYEEVAS